MAPVIGDKGVHFVVCEDLAKQGDRCSQQELETVMGWEVLIVEHKPFDADVVGSAKLGCGLVDDVEEGVDRGDSGDRVVVLVGLEAIEGRGLPLRGGHFVRKFQMVVV